MAKLENGVWIMETNLEQGGLACDEDGSYKMFIVQANMLYSKLQSAYLYLISENPDVAKGVVLGYFKGYLGGVLSVREVNPKATKCRHFGVTCIGKGSGSLDKQNRQYDSERTFMVELDINTGLIRGGVLYVKAKSHKEAFETANLIMKRKSEDCSFIGIERILEDSHPEYEEPYSCIHMWFD